jgi:5-methylcytosine-specific restriction endonuclease McrA
VTLRACALCGAPFAPRSATHRRCPAHEPVGRASRSPTTRAQGATYYRERARLFTEAGDDPRCYWCGAPATTADHIIPVARGGGHVGNLVLACGPCNFSRRADLPR